MIYETKNGINNLFLEWGDKLLNAYGKTREEGYNKDLSLRYLSYSTDNGAFYNTLRPKLSCNPIQNKSCQETLI